MRRVRRWGPEIALALLVIVAAIALWQAWEITQHLRRQAREASRIYGQFIAALNDPTPGIETEMLLNIASEVRRSGLPLIITDPSGRPTAAANLPGGIVADDLRALQYLRQMDRDNRPIEVPNVGMIHFGALPVARRLTWLTAFQLATLVTAVAVGVWAYRSAVHRDRDRLWVAMARESAHQLGTPLMSAAAWIDRLADRLGADDEIVHRLRGDLDRLDRVAKRFERIGRPARRDKVRLGVLVERVATYFQPRLPKHANPVVLQVDAPTAGPSITADPVLLEWALEALVRNAIDALSGRGGTIRITVARTPTEAQLTVADDGPGIDPEVRANIFEPGVSTKAGGWGIGLALSRRIVEDVHGGHLEIAPTERGATFVARLPDVVGDTAEWPTA